MTQASESLSLNCDLDYFLKDGEMPYDIDLVALFDYVNISAGFHRGNPESIAQGIKLAKQHQIGVGGLISYYDLISQGQRSIPHSHEQLVHHISYQIGALQHMAQYQDYEISYIKPHGALFRDMMSDLNVFESVVQAVAATDRPLVILARHDNSPYLDIADEYNVPLLLEAYCDRIYKYDGKLVSREHKHGQHPQMDDIFYQAMQLANFGTVTTDKGQTLALAADTLSMQIRSPQHLSQAVKIAKTLAQTKDAKI
ncbi:MAG: 5-oxoprolinase subunit PxpA [Vibrio sp.]